MNGIWGRSLMLLALLVSGCLIIWPIFGAAAAVSVLVAALLAIAALNLYHISILLRWLRHPTPDAEPQGLGIWDGVFAALYRMLRQQRRSESQLTATLKDFQLAAAAMPDGMVILDQTDRIEWCNPRAERHFGIDCKRDAGQQITYLLRHPQFAGRLQSQNYSEPLMLRQLRGSDLVLSVQIVPYGDRQKLVISRDVTDLERVETMRRDFIANVSHELRTPLTVLGGFLETISDTRAADNDLLRRSLPLMMDQARRMQRLVEDLLTLSRLESANNPLRDERVNVPELARVLYRDAMALSAGRHHVTLNLECEDWLAGSEDELRSAFSNLISNAIRYTPEGGNVTISWQRRGDQAVFAVRDNGIGIQIQHIARLTERFYRVDRSRSRETGGTGLGLAIVKHVLNRHQGRLEVASEPGQGSTFSALFPAQRVVSAEIGEACAATA
ncbi:MAG TPA: phosphate regulon sensor histidine kinase PhoR [Burkholderiales bacterium]|nr:phosphate regulon sensor histidine kinase PhoR [Burkholderiales bacterium]